MMNNTTNERATPPADKSSTPPPQSSSPLQKEILGSTEEGKLPMLTEEQGKILMEPLIDRVDKLLCKSLTEQLQSLTVERDALLKQVEGKEDLTTAYLYAHHQRDDEVKKLIAERDELKKENEMFNQYNLKLEIKNRQQKEKLAHLEADCAQMREALNKSMKVLETFYFVEDGEKSYMIPVSELFRSVIPTALASQSGKSLLSELQELREKVSQMIEGMEWLREECDTEYKLRPDSIDCRVLQTIYYRLLNFHRSVMRSEQKGEG